MATASGSSRPHPDPLHRATVATRWTARGLALASVLFLAFALIGSALFPDTEVPTQPATWPELMGFLFMGILVVGYVLGWWRPLLGGLLGVGSMVAFYAWFSVLRGSPLMMGFVLVLALPGLLYLAEAWLERRTRSRAGGTSG